MRVAGPDAQDYLQRMVSNDVDSLQVGDACPALLLTAKARVIAPLVVWRRGDDDYLLLTEPELGDAVRALLVRMRLRARCEIEPEEHSSVLVFGRRRDSPRDFPGAAEVVDSGLEPTIDARRAGAAPHRGRRAALGARDRRPDPPGRGRARRDARQLHEGLLSRTGAGGAAALPRSPESRPARARARRGAGAGRGARPRRQVRRPRHERRPPRGRFRRRARVRARRGPGGRGL